MQYRSKRFVSLMLVLLMVVSMFPGTALASESETLILGDDLVLTDNVTIITDADVEPTDTDTGATGTDTGADPAEAEDPAPAPEAEEEAEAEAEESQPAETETPAEETPVEEAPAAPALETGEEIAAYDGADETPTEGYMLYIYNADGTVGKTINGTKSASDFSLKSAIEDARVFVDSSIFGITTPATYVVEMYEDSTEDESFAIGSDVTINGNGHNINLADSVALTNNGTLNDVTVIANVTTGAGLIDALEAGGNVKLGNDIVLSNTDDLEEIFIYILLNNNAVLDLNGHTLSLATYASTTYQVLLGGSGTLEIKDSGENGKIIADAECFTVESIYTDGWSAVPSVTVSGGTVNSLSLGEDASVNVTGGDVTIHLHEADYFMDWETEEPDAEVFAAYLTSLTITGVTAEKMNLPEGYKLVDGKIVAEVAAVATVTDSDGTVTNYDSLQEALKALTAGATLTLLQDVTLSEKINVTADLTIDGGNHTLTYTGSDRAIEMPSTADDQLNVSISNLTVDCTASYCQRGINYNDDGTLTLNGVTVKGTNVTYALNLPGSSDGANVTINNSDLSGCIALNVWGENCTINATNSHFTSVDNTATENYSAIVLNNDGNMSADGTTVNITGGSITARDENGEPSSAVRNSTATGTVTVSDSTTVVGETIVPVAIVDYGTGSFYSFTSLEAAIAHVIKDGGGTVKLLRDVELDAAVSLTADITFTLDGNGHTIAPAAGSTETNSAFNWGQGSDATRATRNYTIKNVVFDGWTTDHVVRLQGVTATIDNCQFINCNQPDGLGLLTLTCTDAAVSNCLFKNNTCLEAIDVNSWGDGSASVSTITACTFENNTCSDAGVIKYNDGDGLTVTGCKFLNNTVNTTGNAATVYMGFNYDCEVSNCLFSGNTVTTSSSTTKRFASAIFCDECVVTGNVFLDNTATRNGETVSTVVAAANYLGNANLSQNYWGDGEEPVPGVDYTIEFTNHTVTVDNYYTAYDAESGLSELTSVSYVAKVGKYSYTSLQAAVDAAQDGATVTLLGDASGSGVVIEKNITIDFGGHTYTVTGPAVGSEGTMTLGFQLLAGSDKADPYNVTLTNGTIASTEYDESGVLVLVMNYADLTLSNITLDGKNADSATLVCNNGTSQVIGETNITGASDTAYTLNVDGYSFDYYPSVSLTINTTGTITGKSYFYGDKAAVDIKAGTFTGDINTYDGSYGTADITITGGTFANDVSAYCTETGASLPTLDGRYVVGEAPTATINNLGSMTIPAGDYITLGGGSSDTDMPLSFVMQFLADQNEEDMKTSPYADWYADFVITFTGIEDDSFTADGCYLAGYYGDFGWVKVPVDDMEIEDGVRYPVMLGVGMGQKYEYICSSVKDFRCAMYLTEEILEANPNLQVTLELSVVDNSQGDKAATEALMSTDGSSIYQVAEHQYDSVDFMGYVASISTTRDTYYYTTLQEAFDEAYPGETIDLIADISLSETVVLAAGKNITLNLNGHSVTSTSQPAFRVKGVLDVLDVTGEGRVSSDTGYCFIVGSNSDEGLISGELTIKSGNFFGVTSAVSVTAGVATIEGGYFEATPYQDAYNFTLNCIDANYAAGAARIVVTGGTFYQFDPSDNLAETGGANFCDPNYTGYYDAENQCWIVDELHPVALIGETPYETLEEAIAAAEASDTIVLVDDVALDEQIELKTPITLDLKGYTVISTAQKAFEVYADVTIQNGRIEAVQRCVDTRKAVTLTLKDITLIADEYHSEYKNPQPLTIGGSEAGTVVTLSNCQIDAGDKGYGIISFVKTNLTITDTRVSGFGAVYMKAGSEGSEISLQNSILHTTNDIENAGVNNDFAAVVFETNNITLTVDADSHIEGDKSYGISLCKGNADGTEPPTTGHKITIYGDLTGTYALKSWTAASTVQVIDNGTNVNYLEGEGYVFNDAGVIIGRAVAAIWRESESGRFVSLQAAVDAAGEGDIITLLEDIELTKGVTVAADDVITLDLSGKTLSYTSSANAADPLLKNNGTLTIQDNSADGAGKITYTSTTPDTNHGYATNTITNAGHLTVESGTIENLTTGGASYAIDSAWHTEDMSLTINGGTITATEVAVRQVPYSATATNTVTINGGTLTGATAGLQTFNTSPDANKAEVNIYGGEFNGTYAFYTYYASAQGSAGTTITVDGGTFNGYVYLYNGKTGSSAYPMTVSIRDGKFNAGVYVFTMGASNSDYVYIPAISGGIYTVEPYEGSIAEGYTAASYTDEDGITFYGIVEEEIITTGEAAIGSTVYATLADAIEAAEEGAFINILQDVETVPSINKAVTIINNGGYSLGNADTTMAALVAAVAEGYTVTNVANMGMIFSIALSGAEGSVVAMIGDDTYTTVKAALEAAQDGDTVVLVADVNENEKDSDMIIPQGVTLNLGAYDLMVRSLVGSNGSYVVGSVYSTSNDYATLKAETLRLGENAPMNDKAQSIVPIYVPTMEAYVFSLYIINDIISRPDLSTEFSINAENETLRLKFGQSLSGPVRTGLLQDYSAEENDFRIIVLLSWENDNGSYEQTYVYNDKFVKTAFGDTGQYYTFTLTGYTALGLNESNMNSLKIQAMMITDSGVVAAGSVLTVDNAS